MVASCGTLTIDGGGSEAVRGYIAPDRRPSPSPVTR